MQQTRTKKTFILAWVILALSTALVTFQFLLQFSTGVITPSVMRTFSAGALTASLISSAYYVIYVLMQTPAGILVEQFGPRKLLSVGLLITAFGCFLFATAQNSEMAIIGRIISGGGISCA